MRPYRWQPRTRLIKSVFQGCEQQHHGAADHGVRVQDVVGTFDCRRHPVFAVLEAVQDAQARLHRFQAAGKDDVQVRSVAYHHDGLAPEGDSGVLRLSGRQSAGLAVSAAVYSGVCEYQYCRLQLETLFVGYHPTIIDLTFKLLTFPNRPTRFLQNVNQTVYPAVPHRFPITATR